MLVFEDLHWIDIETQVLLNLFADSIATSRVLMLVNYRPEYTHPLGSKTNYAQLCLDPLGGENAEQMLAAGAEVKALKRLVIDRNRGQSLFIEEIVQAMFDEGTSARNGWSSAHQTAQRSAPQLRRCSRRRALRAACLRRARAWRSTGAGPRWRWGGRIAPSRSLRKGFD
jgi:predicted ATPase